MGDDAVVQVTEIETKQPLDSFRVFRERLATSQPQEVQVEFSPINMTVAALALNEVKVWSGVGKALRTLATDLPENKALVSLEYSPEGELLVAGDETGRLWIWNTNTWEVTVQQCLATSLAAIAFHPSGKRVAVSDFQSVTCWDIDNGKVIFGPLSAPMYPEGHHKLAFRPDGAVFATALADGTARLWDADTGASIETFDARSLFALCLAFAPDGRYLATGSTRIKLWDMEAMAHAVTLDAEFIPIYDMEFSRNGQFLLTAAHDKTVRIWRAPRDNVTANPH